VKQCCGCEEMKPLNDFYNRRAMPDGKNRYCKDCSRSRPSRICLMNGCKRRSGNARYCAPHRRQLREVGVLTHILGRHERERITGPGTTCVIADCARQVHANGMCQAHYSLGKKGRDVIALSVPISCEGCNQDLVRSDYRQQYCSNCKRISYKMRRYGLTARDWFRMLDKQRGACAICLTPNIERFHVDHDHDCCPGERSCGECVRGLLCHACNVALGGFQDEPVLLVSAAVYLQRNGKNV
jgi:hypothetical protein